MRKSDMMPDNEGKGDSFERAAEPPRDPRSHRSKSLDSTCAAGETRKAPTMQSLQPTLAIASVRQPKEVDTWARTMSEELGERSGLKR